MPPTAKAKPLQPTTPSPGFVREPDGSPRYQLDATQLKKARAWYVANAAQYTPNVIAQLQVSLKEQATGKLTDSFLQAVAYWQSGFDLMAAAGRGTQVGNVEHGGYLPTGVLTPEQVSRLFPSGLAKPTQIAKYATNVEELIAMWNTIGGYDGRRRALYAVLEQQLEAVGVIVPKFNLGNLSPGTMGTYDSSGHELRINSEFLRRPQPTPLDIREFLSTLYHEARHAEQAFMVARLLYGNGLKTDDIYKQTRINPTLLKAAAAKPIRADSPAGIVANEWYQSKYGALAAQRSQTMSDLNTNRMTIASVEQSLAAIETRRKTLEQQLQSGKLPAAEKTRVKNDLDLLAKQARDMNNLLTELNQTDAVNYQNYRNIPGERDAWDVEGAASTYYYRHLEK
nr:hypothetical protein [Deinococcus sp. RM]